MKEIESLHVIPSIIAIIIIVLLIIASISLAYYASKGKNSLISICALILYVFVGAVLFPVAQNIIDKNYSSCILINHENIKLNVDSLPNDIVNIETNVFLVNENEFPTIKEGKVLYRNDSKDSPYIVCDKVTYKAPNKWYVNSKYTQKINNDIKYILKEVHH